MAFSDALSVAAVLTAVVSAVVSYLLSRGADRRSRIPVLVFTYDPERGWLLRNVGNGPALNILVARHTTDRGWFDPVRVPPIARDAELVLAWLGHWDSGTLGATYEDFLGADRAQAGRAYTVTCGRDMNHVRPGRHLTGVRTAGSVAMWEATAA